MWRGVTGTARMCCLESLTYSACTRTIWSWRSTIREFVTLNVGRFKMPAKEVSS